MRYKGGVTYYSSRPTCRGLAGAIKRLPGSAAVATSRPFVLVHGIGVSYRYFHPLAGQLAKSGEVFLIDPAGYGSVPDPKRDVSIPLNADVLCTFLQRAGVGNPVLAGHSIGSPLILATGYLARCGIPCFFAQLRLASLIVKDPA